MNYSCPNCGDQTIYDPVSGKMECLQCGKLFSFSYKEEDNIEPEEKQPVGLPGEERARLYRENIGKEFSDIPQETYMEVNVYRCTSCGAELMINDREASTFCAFCGQPTIVFDRVSKELQPNYIIPFRISEREAVERIKHKFSRGGFVPKEVRNPDIDKMRGIYIPFWLFTSYIRMQANLIGNTQHEIDYVDDPTDPNVHKAVVVENYKLGKSIKFYRDGDCVFEKVTVDASRKMDDQMSQRLEPYNLKALRSFDAKYLSGFYADKYDVETQEIADIAHYRISEFMEENIKQSCNAFGIGVEIVEKKEEYRVDSIEYALLPAWFMTFHYKKELYTILVNGQTGKVVGNVPISKKKVVWWFTGVLLLSIMAWVYFYLFVFMGLGGTLPTESVVPILIILSIFNAVLFVLEVRKWRAYKRDQGRFKSQTTLQYVKKRQDKTWIR